VAVVIGGAFGKVVDAVVGLVMGSLLEPAGSVIVALINFAVIALVVFLIVRALEAMRRADAAVATPDPQAQLASSATRLADALDRRQL
jgi:large conductance mechanosensitive channel